MNDSVACAPRRIVGCPETVHPLCARCVASPLVTFVYTQTNEYAQRPKYFDKFGRLAFIVPQGGYPSILPEAQNSRLVLAKDQPEAISIHPFAIGEMADDFVSESISLELLARAGLPPDVWPQYRPGWMPTALTPRSDPGQPTG